MLLDIHTHRSENEDSPHALLNFSPKDFHPVDGHFYSVGLHPWDAHTVTDIDWQLLQIALRHPAVRALGEVGLDSHAASPLSLQQEVLCRQLALADQWGKPVVLHAVGTMQHILPLPLRYPHIPAWVIHGFRGKRPQAEQWLRHGFYLSFGAHFQTEALQIVPVERLLAETDESPDNIHNIVLRLADARGVQPGWLTARLQENAEQLFFHP